MARRPFLLVSWSLVSIFSWLASVGAYEVPVSDTDYSRQVCSGMWASQSTFINGRHVCIKWCCDPHAGTVTFDSLSQGHLAMVIYEWQDNTYLGKTTSTSDDSLPVNQTICSPSLCPCSECAVAAENIRLHVKCSQRRFLHSGRIRALHIQLSAGQVHQRH